MLQILFIILFVFLQTNIFIKNKIESALGRSLSYENNYLINRHLRGHKHKNYDTTSTLGNGPI